MKKIFIFIATCISFISVMAQEENTCKGYCGMLDVGFNFNANGGNAPRLTISTTHGFQFTPHIFLGAGIQADVLTNPGSDYKSYALPCYISFKWNILNKKWTPYTELRGGYSVAGNTGHYMSFALGLRQLLRNRNAMTFAVGGAYQSYKIKGLSGTDSELNNGPFIKVGIEF